VGRSTGMPALNFLNALKNENIDINKIKIIKTYLAIIT